MGAESLRAVEADAASTVEGVTVTLHTEDGDVDILVPPAGRWFTEANEALQVARYDRWAQVVLAPADLEKWKSVRRRNDDMTAFFKDWETAAGESRGKSRRSATS